MPLNDPFDVIRNRRGPQLTQDPGDNDGSSSLPEDAPTPFSMALQQQRQQAPADLAYAQQQQARSDAANQKAQAAQNKIDAANQAAQEKADAENLKANGAVTQATVAAGPDGRSRVIQQQQTNPDGTPAYQPGPMGIKYGPDGSPYSVARTQWGTQDWSSPYAPAKANLKLNPTGQIMATPKGKGAAALPQQDVTTQGVTGLDAKDAAGNPDPSQLQVAPDAPINQPQIVPQINAEEQKLVQQAATQRVKDTVGKDADDAAQALADARGDHTDAQAALAEAKANAKTSMTPDQAQKDVDAAQQTADAKRNALIAAGKDAAAKRNVHQQALADPLGFLQSQQQTNAPALASPPTTAPSPSGTAQPSDIAASTAQPSPTPVAGAVPDPSRAPSSLNVTGTSLNPSLDSSASPDSGALNLDASGNVSVANPVSIPRVPSLGEMTGSVLKSVLGNVTAGTGDVVKGLAHGSRYINPVAYGNAIVKSFLTPEQAQAIQSKQLDVTGAAEGIGDWFQKGGEKFADKSVAPDLKNDPLIGFFGGGARFVPSMVTGSAAIVTGAAQMAQQFKDAAAANGRTPAQQEAAFGIGALTGAALNKAVGMIPILHDATNAPEMLKVLGADGVTTDILKSFGKGIVRSGLEGFGLGAAQQLAAGGTNTLGEDAKSSLMMLPFALLGPAFRGLGLRDVSNKVDAGLAAVNKGVPPEQQVSRGDYLNSLIQQSQYVEAQRTLTTAQAQFAKIEASTSLSPEQAMRAKASVMAKVPSDIRPMIQLHLDDAADAQRQANQAVAPMDAAAKNLPKADPKLAKLSDAELSANAQVDPTNGGLQAETSRRQQVAALDQQRQQAIGQVTDRLRSSMVAGNELARTPEGRQAIQAINDFNASQPSGAPKADALTAQKASDLAPRTAEVAIQPTVGHYLPVAHAIEQLGNPDQQAMATAAIKLSNGRGLTDDDRTLMLGSDDGSQPKAVTPSGQPFAKVEGQRPILTDAGLARLRALVPQASDILPKSEQAQLEAQPPPLPKGTKAQPSTEQKPVNQGTVQRTPPLPSAPDPGLAKMDDETLRVRHESVTAAIAKAKAAGGDSPPTVYAHRDRLATELARRQAAITPPEANAVGARDGAKEGDEIDYTRTNHEGKPVATRGEVTEVHPTHYRVVDANDGVERTVPKTFNDETKPETKTEDAKPVPVAGGKDEAAGGGDAGTPAAKPTQPADIHLPGIDPKTIKPEQAEAAKLLADAFQKNRGLFEALGLDPDNVFQADTGSEDGTVGVWISPNDPSKIKVNLTSLTKNLGYLNTPGKRRLRMDAILEEEAIHIAGEKVLGTPEASDTVHRGIWNSLTPEQQDKVIAEYGPHLERAAGGDDDGLDANRGREYIRMLVQLERSGRTTEWSNKLSGKTVEYLKQILQYMKSILKPGNQAAADLVKRIQGILDKGSDEDNFDMSPPTDEPPVPHFDFTPITDEEARAQEKARKEMMTQAFGDRDSLLDAVKKAGGIPTSDPALQGELQNVKEGKNKGTMMQLFRKNAKPLDRLREALSEKGFHFDTPAQMLDAILDSVRTGKPVYGAAVDQWHADRLERQLAATGKAPQDLTPLERRVVAASARHISTAADDLRRVVAASGLDHPVTYPGPLPMTGMPEGELDPAQRAIEAKFAQWVQDDPDRAARAYAALPETEGGRVIDMDEARKLSPDYSASRHSKTLHSVSVQKVVNVLAIKKLLPDALQSLQPADTMGFTAGGPGSGKGNIKKIIPAEWYGAKHVYDGVLRDATAASSYIDASKGAGAKARLWYVHVPVEKAVDQAVGRASYEGRSLPIKVLATGHFQAQRTFIDLLQKYAGDPDVDMKVVDNSGPTARVVDQPLSFLQNERILYRDEAEVKSRAEAAFEGHAHRLSDPDAVSIFRTGKTLGNDVDRGPEEADRPGDRRGSGDREQGVGRLLRGAKEEGPATGGPTEPTSGASPEPGGSPDAAASRPVVGASEIADRPEVEQPLARYLDALHQGELHLDQPGQLDFAREYQTDMGQRPPEPLVARARELEVQPGEADQATGKTPDELFHNHLDVADRIAGSFDNIPGFQPDDAKQVARVALKKAADTFDSKQGVPFRGYAPRIVRNALRDAYRFQDRRAVEQPTLDAPIEKDSELTGKDLVESKEPTSAEAVASKDAHGQLRDYISRVSMAPESRKALNSLLDGRDQAEIATDLKVSPQRVSAMIGTGLEQLRKVFAEKGIKRNDLVGGAAIRDQTETPEFKSWFGDSKVVDAQGNPLRVFHGTAQTFDSFDPNRRGNATEAPSARQGYFFTNDPLVASNYSEIGYREGSHTSLYTGKELSLEEAKQLEHLTSRHGPDLYQSPFAKERQRYPINRVSMNEAARAVRKLMEQGDSFSSAMSKAGSWELANAVDGEMNHHDAGQGSNVVPSYLSLKNPLVHDFKGTEYRDRTYNHLLTKAKADGHDGAIFKNTFDDPGGSYSPSKSDLGPGEDLQEWGDPHDVYIAFDPEQIKSATGNRGTFDPNDERITHAGAIPDERELPDGVLIKPEDLVVDHTDTQFHDAKDAFDPQDPTTWPFANASELESYKTDLDAFDKDDPDTWDPFLVPELGGEHGNVTELADDTASIADRLEAQEGVNPALARKARQLADEVRAQIDQTILPIAQRNADYVRGILDQAKAKAEAYFKPSDDPDVNLARTDIDVPDTWPQAWQDDYARMEKEAGIGDGDYQHPRRNEVNDAFDAKYRPLIEAAEERVEAKTKRPEQGNLFGAGVQNGEEARTPIIARAESEYEDHVRKVERRIYVVPDENDPADYRGDVVQAWNGGSKYASGSIYRHGDGHFSVTTYDDKGGHEKNYDDEKSYSEAEQTLRDDLRERDLSDGGGFGGNDGAIGEMAETLKVPRGMSVKDARVTANGSIYFHLEIPKSYDEDGHVDDHDDLKLRIGDHEPSPFREKEFGASDHVFYVKDIHDPKEVSAAMTRMEAMLEKVYAPDVVLPPNDAAAKVSPDGGGIKTSEPRSASTPEDARQGNGEVLKSKAHSKDIIAGSAVKDDPEAFSREALGFKPAAPGGEAPKPNQVVAAFKAVGDGLMQAWHPQGRGEEAAWTARSLQANLGEAALSHYRDQIAFESASRLFARKSIPESLAFIDSIETGTKNSDPALEAIAQKLRVVNDRKASAVRTVAPQQFKGFIENYFPHIFKQADQEKAQSFFRKKIEGSRAFLKHRSIPTIAEAVKAGLELESHNPVDLFLKRWGQMDKFVAAQKMINEGKQADVFKEFPNEANILPGYVRIDPKIGYSSEEVPDKQAIEENRRARQNPELFPTGRKDRPETMQRFVPLYAPEQAATVLNNYLSPGLRNHPNAAVSGSFKVLTGAANLMNSAQLGLSAFHLGFTTVDTMVSKLALAVEQMEQGHGIKSLKSLGSLGTTPFTNLLQGHQLLSELKHPGTRGPEMAALADLVTAGGGRAGLDPVYSDQWTKSFMNAIHERKPVGVVARAPFAAVEALAKPIMEWIVPRQKLGVFADLARHEMDKLGPNAAQDDVRGAMQKAWASVDNRMGQLVYDNLHWNKTAKDVAMVAMRSVGWNIGTVRELGGGYIDAAKYVARSIAHIGAKNGEDLPKPEFTHKMAYALALHLLLGGMGTLTGYLLTGKGPENLTDAFFPKTGFKDAGGHDARIAFPSYVKDEAAYLHAPLQTVENKANPLLSEVFSLYNNKDYFGTQIRNPDDPAYQQALDTAEFAGKEMLPFAIQGGNKFAEASPPPVEGQGPLTRALGTQKTHFLLNAGPFVGLTPASAYLSTSPAEKRAQELEERIHGGDTHDKDEAASYQKYLALRNQFAQNDPRESGIAPEEQDRRQKLMAAAFQQATKEGTLKPGGVPKLVEAARKPPLQRMFEGIIQKFQMEGDAENAYRQAKSIWDLATPEERKQLAPKMVQVWATARTKRETSDPNPVTSPHKQ